jgi:acetyltransferase-like isoleucine patch superfamily enzyme
VRNAVVGGGSQIDESVLLGYPTGRKIEVLKTVIGDRARIRSNTVIYTNVVIGDDLETGHNVIGDSFRVWNNSAVDYGCRIGNGVRIHNNVYVAQYTVIEDDVFLAPGVIIANDPHPICTKCMRGPTIKRGARIGVNATLLPGITVGDYSLVGAGSVVTVDVPPHTVVYGVPARPAKAIDELECPLNLVDRPYLQGRDVQTRERKAM